MSKANQAFKQNDEAVSPVIGVILMVAITVVLAAVVFVLVSNLGKGTDAKPQVGFTKDEQGAAEGGILTVATITNGPIDLEMVVIGGTSHTAAACTFNGAAMAAGGGGTGEPSASDDVLAAAGQLKAGDQITCTEPGTITLSEFTTGTLLYSGSFT
jgi:flagellin-like protein